MTSMFLNPIVSSECSFYLIVGRLPYHTTFWLSFFTATCFFSFSFAGSFLLFFSYFLECPGPSPCRFLFVLVVFISLLISSGFIAFDNIHMPFDAQIYVFNPDFFHGFETHILPLIRLLIDLWYLTCPNVISKTFPYTCTSHSFSHLICQLHLLQAKNPWVILDSILSQLI